MTRIHALRGDLGPLARRPTTRLRRFAVAVGSGPLARIALGLALLGGCRPAASTTEPRPATSTAAPRLVPPLTAAARHAALAHDIAGLLATDEPHHLALAAELLADRGDLDEARRVWSRARAGFLARGATVRLQHLRAQSGPRALAVAGDRRLEIVERARTDATAPYAPPYAESLAELRVGPLDAASARRSWWPRPIAAFVALDDGRTLVHDDGPDIVVRDVATGLVVRRIATPHPGISRLAATLRDDGVYALSAVDERAVLWDPRGRAILELAAPGGVTALALRRDAGLLAIGTADAIVIADRRGVTRRLALPATAADRPNPPRALRFTPAGERLVVAFAGGELVVWDPRDGTKLLDHPGRCTTAEVDRALGDRRRELRTPEVCSAARSAAISRDGAFVATRGAYGHVRTRGVETGDTLDIWRDGPRPGDRLDITTAGAAIVGGSDGTVLRLRPGEPASTIVPAAHTPHSLVLRPDRVLEFDRKGADPVAWDLLRRRPVSLPAPSPWLASDGRHAAVKLADRVEVRDLATGEVRVAAELQGGGSASALVAAQSGLFVLAVDQPDQRRVLLVDPWARTSRWLGLPTDAGDPALLSPDGRWLVTSRFGLQVWDTTNARLRHATDGLTAHAKFTGDSAWLAWSELDAVHRLQLRGSAAPQTTSVAGFGGLDFTPDDRALWAVGIDHLVRWSLAEPRPGAPLQIQADGAREALHVDPAGGVLFVVGAHLEVFTVAGVQVAAVYPTAAGGYAALSAAGAVDGSDDAPAEFVARVARGDEVRFYDARLAWAADRVPDLVPRALAGADVSPPR